MMGFYTAVAVAYLPAFAFVKGWSLIRSLM